MSPTRLAALAAIAALLVAGCGGGGSSKKPNGEASKSASQITADATAALSKITSFHIDGTETDKDGLTTVTGDVGLPGRLHLSVHNGAATVDLIVIKGDAYLRANKQFWDKIQGAPGVGKLLADKWVKAPVGSTSGFGEFEVLSDPNKIGRCFIQSHHGTITKSGTGTVAGQAVVILQDKGETPGSTPGRLYVATNGAPLPVRAQVTGPQTPGGAPDAGCNETAQDMKSTTTRSELNFSAYDKKVDISPPAGAVDLSTLTGGGSTS